MPLTSPNGTPISVRPIEPFELGRIVLRCWPERPILDQIFAEQGTIGMAAWEGDRCVAQLHCYCVMLPDGENENWLKWCNWWAKGWKSEALRQNGPVLDGPAWFHGCLHVGRTLDSDQEGTRELVYRFAGRNDWDPLQTLQALNALDGVYVNDDTVKDIIKELRSSGQTTFNTIEPQYYGRGIGTALCEASVSWARQRDYVAVMALGAPDNLFEFAAWSGHLPWTSYEKLGFKTAAIEQMGAELPGWARGDSPPEVMAEVRAALVAGRPTDEIRERLMFLDLHDTN
jgi:GNAT superfamily N-acetyltransferase